MNLVFCDDGPQDDIHLLSPRSGCESREKSLLRVGAHPPSWRVGCPIDFQQAGKMDPVPEHTANHGIEPGETVGPLAEKCLKTQQDIEQQGDPDLPAQTSRARALQLSRAVSAMAKRGSRLCRSSRRWHLAAIATGELEQLQPLFLDSCGTPVKFGGGAGS